ncbi:Regulator of arginine metabolism, MADS box-containing transcription factor [Trachipleistophora hominis]|uniref:Regulator of arginine metabolism, MADS box-containing transcription factor n=1 Tax=Trachipleistophora hominis TaxID=72359 RepID=L7JWP8_TRAHO|nr:Regulator of arginine metabolism, MADS box-containing transcription factor [Trachipleistophora hominis]
MNERKKRYSDEHEEEIVYTNENGVSDYQYQNESMPSSYQYYQSMRYDDRFPNSYQDDYNYRYNTYHEPPRHFDPRYEPRNMHYNQEYGQPAYERPAGMTAHEFPKTRIEEENMEIEHVAKKKATKSGRKKIKMAYIEGKNKRSVTFSKRKKGIMKKAYELNMLTKSQILLLVASESGHVYTFATPKLKPIISKHENLIQQCLNAPSTPDKSKFIPDMDENGTIHDSERHPYVNRQDYYDGGYDSNGRDYDMSERK